jgi:4a-hydroxytetrahydrobiopterin dehydratase
MALLDEDAIKTSLQDLPDWSREGDTLVRTFRRRDWQDAIALLNGVAPEADRRNHHPDVSITGYRDITFRLTTHSAGGVTQRDVDLAAWIDTAAASSNEGAGQA